MGVSLGNQNAVIDPASLYDECLEHGMPTSEWLGKANRFVCPLGPEPGTGFVLMQRAAFAKLDPNARHDLVFSHAGQSQTFKGLIITSSRCVTPGVRDDASACMLVGLADRRQHLQRIPVNKAYNLFLTDGSGYQNATTADGAGTAWTWQGMVNDLCVVLGIPNITLPYTPNGTPANWDVYEDSAWLALNEVFAKLSIAVRWKPTSDTFDAVELGKSDNPAAAALVLADSFRDWDWEPSGLTYARVPEKVSVQYVRYPQPSDGTSPYHVVDVAAPGSVTTATAVGSKIILPDDLPALCDTANVVINTGDCNARATERRDKWYQMVAAWAVSLLSRRYTGILSGATLLPGQIISHYAVLDLGGGYRTEIARLKVPAVRVEFPIPVTGTVTSPGGDLFAVVKDHGTDPARGNGRHLRYDADLPSPQWTGDDFQTDTVTKIWLVDRRRAKLAPTDRVECHRIGTFDPRFPIGSGTVTNATNATPIVITTSQAHTLQNGDTVTIAGVTGNTAANGTFVITFINSTSFSLNGSAGNGAYISGGTWTYVDTGKSTDSRALYACLDAGLHVLKVTSDNPVQVNSGGVITFYWPCVRMYTDTADHTWKTSTGDFWVKDRNNHEHAFKNNYFLLAHLVDEIQTSGSVPKKAVYTALATGVNIGELMKCIMNQLFVKGGCLIDAGTELHVRGADGNDYTDLNCPTSYF